MTERKIIETMMDVEDRQKFDASVLSSWMGKNIKGFSGTISVKQFKGGQSNPTFYLEGPNQQRYVMRSKPAPKSKLLPSAHAIEREFRIMRALSQVDFPVPEVFALCDDESVLGRAFYIMEYVEGRIFWNPELPEVEKPYRAAYYDEMNRVLANLHKIDYKKLGLEDFGKPGNYFSRQIDRWLKQYRAAETNKIEAMENLIQWFPQNIPEGDDVSIVHGDFRFDNMIFHPTEPRVLAVVDWEISTLGNPLGDFSYNCLPYHIPGGVVGLKGLAGLDLENLGIPSESSYINNYCERTGRSKIDHWEFYLAFNFFRLASICQGVYKRALDGIASNPKALELGQNILPLASLGWEIAKKGNRR